MTKKTKLFRNLSFGLAVLTIVVLVCASVLETVCGTNHIYGSPLFVALWTALAVFSIVYIIIRKMQRRKIILLLHLSFVVILAGAFITHVWGVQGSIHLRQGEMPVCQFITNDGINGVLPFEISLNSFELVYYQGTFAPMDYVSSVLIHDGDGMHEGVVSMNNIYDYKGYRFYQSTYDYDRHGSTLSIYYDPYGIAVTYIGYVLLILSVLLFFFDPKSYFRQLLNHPLLRKSVMASLLAVMAFPSFASDTPKTLPRSTAVEFGNMYVYYNDRVCPMQTLARDFTVKLYGKSTYKGMTAEQVLTGWFFYYDDWKTEPIIYVKSKEVRQLLGIEGKYARLVDFFDNNGYKLDYSRHQETGTWDMRGVREADEKFNLISMVSTGNALKMYPYRENDSLQLVWYSISERLPASMPHEQWAFVRYSMNYIAEQVAKKDFDGVNTLIVKTRKYQEREAAGFLPDNTRFRAEKLYNAFDYTRPVAMVCLMVGILSFFFYCWRMLRGRTGRSWLDVVLLALIAVLLFYIVTVMTLRGITAGHFPATNGFETMQLMAACVLVISILSYRRFEAALSFGFILCGLAMLVAMMGESNPSVTPLLPVLSSPLLSIHVMTIMISYSLFGFAMLNGIVAIIIRYSGRACFEQVERLQVISQLILYPAVFLLAIGIFIGAVWANVSWGRYWGWDPKETWALITLLVYAAALHLKSLPAMRRPMFFHWFTVIAFFCVLITYFGANFIMKGLHSYA